MDSTTRPSVACTFAVMGACDAQMGDDPAARRACVDGARAAHLQHEPAPPPEHAEAYRVGWNSAMLTCPIESSP